MTTVIIAAVLQVLCIGILWLYANAMRKAAKAAVADTERLDVMIHNQFTVTVAGPDDEWGVIRNSKVIVHGYDLRAVLDEANHKVNDHG